MFVMVLLLIRMDQKYQVMLTLEVLLNLMRMRSQTQRDRILLLKIVMKHEPCTT